MSAAARLAGFAAALAAAFAIAVAAGEAVGPTHRAADADGGEAHATGGGAEAEHAETTAPQGLAVADGDLRVVPARSRFPLGASTDFGFRIVDARGRTVRAFDLEHERRMHLIVVRRDMTRYVHVHPEQAADGSWNVPLRFDAAGTYRVFADFTPRGGERTTLGTDVAVGGRFAPEPLPAPAASASAGPYRVTVAGAPEAGAESELRFTVTRDGRPVQVEPYLGADGHLVTLREGDLAYLHAHPGEHAGGGPIRFAVEHPSAGRYRLFLQFKHRGVVRTAAFTQEVR